MSAQYEILPPGGHETMLEAVFNKIKSILPNDENVKQKNYTTYDGKYRLLLSGTDDDTERTERVGKSSHLTYNPWTDEFSILDNATLGVFGSSGVGGLLIRHYDIQFNNSDTWDGTHTSLKDTITYLGSQSAVNKVDKTGDTMSGDISWNGETGYTSGLYWKEYGYGDKFKIAPSFSGSNDDNFLGFQAAVGGAGTDPDLAVILKIHPSGKITTTNQVIGKNPASSWIGARDAACFKNPNFANNGSYYPVISTKSKSGTWSIGVLSNEEQLRFCWESDSNYSSGKNESTSVILRATAGTIALTSEILPKAGGTMTGNLVCGNTTIYSSGSNGGRNSVLIGDDCKLGDCNVGGMLGLQAVSGSNCGIRLYNSSGGLVGGFQSSNGTPQWINNKGTATTISLNGHTHSYLPLTGGTLTGHLQLGSGNKVYILRTALIARHDTGDSGYVNIVTYTNSAYSPIRASGFTTMSCKHTKTNVIDISEEDALKLLDIRPVNFDYIEEVGGQKNQIGVLAEDTYEILPKVVSVPDDYKEEDFDISKGIHQPLPSVDYAKFVPYLIKMVQIQQKEINELKEQLRVLV